MRARRAKATRSGFTLIELMIVIAIIAIIAAIAIPNLLAARKHGNETAAIGALKTITNAQSMFREGDKDGNGTNDYGTLTALGATQVIDSILGAGTRQGYLFRASASASTPEFLWFATANPALAMSSGDRYFCTQMQGTIFYTTAGSMAMNSVDCTVSSTYLPVGK
jgi:type IV pilus assembly protein PilA